MLHSYHCTFEFRGFTKVSADSMQAFVERSLTSCRVVFASAFGDTIVVDVETPIEPNGELNAIARSAWLAEERFAEIELIVRDKTKFDKWKARSEAQIEADDQSGEDDPGHSHLLTLDDYDALIARMRSAS